MPKTKYKKRSDGRYMANVSIGYDSEGKRIFKSLYGKTVRELEEKIATFKSDLQKGIIISDENLSLGEWSNTWLANYKSGVSYNTQEMYRRIIKKIESHPVSKKKLSKIKTSDLQNLVNQYIDADHIDSAQKARMTLVQIFRQAQENELIYKNVAEFIKVPKKHKRPKRALTEDEVTRITSTDCGEQDKVFVYIALYAGLRRGEALALTWKDVNLKERTITVHQSLIFKGNESEIKDFPKSDSGNRTIPIPDKLYKCLAEYKLSSKNIYLFHTQNNGLPTKSYFRKMWERIVCDSGCDEVTPHLLRHTYATNLVKAGVDIKTAQKLLGHASVQLTLDIYTHIDIDSADTISKLNAII